MYRAEPTPTEQKALDFIIGYMLENGFCPSLTEIQKGLNYASPAVSHQIIEQMENKGLIERPIPGAPRAIRIPGVHYVIEK